MKRRFIFLIAALVLISIGWTVTWSYLSGKAGVLFAQGIEKINRQDQQLSCDNQRTEGFPFRLAIRCDDPSYEKAGAFSVQSAGLHAQAFVYRPNHQVVDFKSPAEISVGSLGRLKLTWEKARLGSKLSTDGLNAATARMENTHLSLIDPPIELQNSAIKADNIFLSARLSNANETANSLVLGILSKGVSVLGTRYALPPVSLEASVLAFDTAELFKRPESPFKVWIEKGGEADIHAISLTSGSAHLFTKGWVKLDQDGFIHADLDVDAANLASFIDQMGPELIQFQTIMRGIAGAIEGLGESVDLEGKPAKRVKVTIRKGFINIGVIPLGAIPQIDLSQL